MRQLIKQEAKTLQACEASDRVGLRLRAMQHEAVTLYSYSDPPADHRLSRICWVFQSLGSSFRTMRSRLHCETPLQGRGKREKGGKQLKGQGSGLACSFSIKLS